jgi:hypothetical protein
MGVVVRQSSSTGHLRPEDHSGEPAPHDGNGIGELDVPAAACDCLVKGGNRSKASLHGGNTGAARGVNGKSSISAFAAGSSFDGGNGGLSATRFLSLLETDGDAQQPTNAELYSRD